jgi:hypothetical protein
MATIQGRPVDRPAVSFYEIGGFDVDPDDPDPYNIYNDPSWRPLLELAEQHTDLIRMRGPHLTSRHADLRRRFYEHHQQTQGMTRWHTMRIRVAGRELVQVQRRDAQIDTVWTTEHLLKGEDDVRAFLQLPDEVLDNDVDCSPILDADRDVGQRGIVMVETSDPLCQAGSMMSMEDYTVLALTDPPLFHALLTKLARPLYDTVNAVADACPGRLWRICGPEYAGEPYLPPRLFDEYVVRYGVPIVEAIHRSGGYARIHCHGRLRNILPMIAGMGADATDPIEPPPQGDMHLHEVRRDYGKQMALFGNLEASDLETLEPYLFEQRIDRAIREGTEGTGRGFVLMPSACPYGRTITPRTLTNYQNMVRRVGA